MTKCLKCGKDDLEWVKDKGRWKLLEVDSGDLHIITCRITKTEYHTMNTNTIYKNISCPHGILTSRACDICDNARRGEPLY